MLNTATGQRLDRSDVDKNQTDRIPTRAISGKISELAVRAAIHGEPVKNTDALANPQALENFRSRVEL